MYVKFSWCCGLPGPHSQLECKIIHYSQSTKFYYYIVPCHVSILIYRFRVETFTALFLRVPKVHDYNLCGSYQPPCFNSAVFFLNMHINMAVPCAKQVYSNQFLLCIGKTTPIISMQAVFCLTKHLYNPICFLLD